MAWIVLKTPKLISNLSRSILEANPAAVTLATNKLYFYQMTLGKDIRAQEGIPALKMAPLPTKRPEFAKKAKITPKNIMLPSGRSPDKCFISNQPLYF